ncbi:MAG: hypothetical protein JSU77_08755 [Fidelibacterota bacterium]|nr:MAG: hypothetical protein JSU77_08755 [Candidatus Neomarinimicrobiota bacterium]
MHQEKRASNEEQVDSRIATSQRIAAHDDSGRPRLSRTCEPARIRSLFIDGCQAHARLRLPIRSRAFDRQVHSPADGLTSVILAADPPAGGLDDLEPTEGDLVPFTFRLLSAAYLGTGGYHLDFSREGVLERSLALFREPEEEGSARQNPLVVVRDHSFSIEDRIGLVRNARWSPENPDYGLPHPGIEAELHINWKLAGEVVRRLLHDPPLLDACSVSLGFGWEKSHPGLEDHQFWQRLGEEVDGSAVRVIVTEILSVEHVGLVFAGADSSARRAGSSAGQRNSTFPGSADASALGDSPEEESRQATITACLANRPVEEISMKGGDPIMEMQTITINSDSPLLGILGVVEPDLQLLEQRAGELKHLAELGREALADLRQEVKALIIQLDGAAESEPSSGLLKVVQTADVTTLKALKDEYSRRLDNLIPACCHVCGSEQVSRRSSRETSLTEGNRDADDPALYR